jgi:hypothetical protein
VLQKVFRRRLMPFKLQEFVTPLSMQRYRLRLLSRYMGPQRILTCNDAYVGSRKFIT